jgi:hypothetical protein
MRGRIAAGTSTRTYLPGSDAHRWGDAEARAANLGVWPPA